MKKRVYVATSGAQFNPKKAQTYGLALEKIGTDIKAEDVVAAAKKTTSPLHELFEWDDKRAARKYRIEQARHVLQHIAVKVVDSSGNQKELRAFHSIPFTFQSGDKERTERRYVHINVIEKEPEQAQSVVEQAKEELQEWRQRHRDLDAYFGPVFKEIDKVA